MMGLNLLPIKDFRASCTTDYSNNQLDCRKYLRPHLNTLHILNKQSCTYYDIYNKACIKMINIYMRIVCDVRPCI